MFSVAGVTRSPKSNDGWDTVRVPGVGLGDGDGLGLGRLTVIVTGAAPLWSSLNVTVQLPCATGVTVKLADGPFPLVGETIAMLAHEAAES